MESSNAIENEAAHKILVVYYSRTGNTRKIAQEIATKLGCDIEELIDTKNRKGFLGYLKSGYDAIRKRPTILQPLKTNAEEYDLVIIGTPIWGWNVSTPVRTYIIQNRGKFNKIAFFCTMGGSGDAKAFETMSTLTGLVPVSTMAITEKELKGGRYSTKLEKFISELRK